MATRLYETGGSKAAQLYVPTDRVSHYSTATNKRVLRPSRAPPVGHSAHRPTPPDRLSTHRHQDAHSHRQRDCTQHTAAQDSHTACCADTEGRARSTEPDAARDGAQTTGRDGQTRGHGRPRFRGPPRWVAAALHGVRSRGTAPTQGRETIDGGKGPLFGLRGETAGQTRGAEGRQGAFEKLCGGSAALHGAVCRRRALETAIDPSRDVAWDGCRRLCWAAGVDSALVDCWKTE